MAGLELFGYVPKRRAGLPLLPPCMLNWLGGGLQAELDDATAAGERLGRELAGCQSESAAAHAMLAGALAELDRLQGVHEGLRTALGLEAQPQGIPASPVLAAWEDRTPSPLLTSRAQAAAGEEGRPSLRKDCQALKLGLEELSASMGLTLSRVPTKMAISGLSPARKSEASMEGSPSKGSVEEELLAVEDRANKAEAMLEKLEAEAEASAAAHQLLRARNPEVRQHVQAAVEELVGLSYGEQSAAATEAAVGRMDPQAVLAMRDWVLELEAQLAEGMKLADKQSRENENLLAQIEQLEKNLGLVTDEKSQKVQQLQGELMEVCIWASELEQECNRLEQDCSRMYSLLPPEAKEQCKSTVVAQETMPEGIPDRRVTAPSFSAQSSARKEALEAMMECVTPTGNSRRGSLQDLEDSALQLSTQRSPSESGVSNSSPFAAQAPRLWKRSNSFQGGSRRLNSLRRPPQLQLYRSLSSMPGRGALPASTSMRGMGNGLVTASTAPAGQLSSEVHGWIAQTEQLHNSIQGKAREAREVLITRLESALERISAAETALAEKNREIKALKEGGRRSNTGTTGTPSPGSNPSRSPTPPGKPTGQSAI